MTLPLLKNTFFIIEKITQLFTEEILGLSRKSDFNRDVIFQSPILLLLLCFRVLWSLHLKGVGFSKHVLTFFECEDLVLVQPHIVQKLGTQVAGSHYNISLLTV